MQDSEGKEIQVGSMVVYNQSGDLVRGTVVRISETLRYRRNGYLFHIRKVDTDHISKVKNARSIFVLI
jgi:hypothetical protein